MFERTADTLKWPKKVLAVTFAMCVNWESPGGIYIVVTSWTVLDYDKVKAAVLRAFELPIGKSFAGIKSYTITLFLSLGREKEALFDRWCHASKVTEFEQLRELILLEEFKNCLSDRLATYINEQKALTLAAATVLADEYVLTRKDSFERTPVSERSSYSSWRKSNTPHSDKSSSSHSDNVPKMGHTINKCFTLKNKSQPPKSVVLIKSESLISASAEPVRTPDPEFQPFLMKGFCLFDRGGDSKVPVHIIRDTASNQSVILSMCCHFQINLPLNQMCSLEVLICDMWACRFITSILSQIWSRGCVKVGVRAQLPIEGVTLLLGNDLGWW
ncbi:hypothetical protein N1851_026732 [Merluccius polli]|uniref:SCAN box domain-containing protein n=1 Tax=Merluccius polli TaxID=89951 RepID=A0AA47MB82_MERPO|nr:hypothetical protein N1851_026732 [Merluccius polli]